MMKKVLAVFGVGIPLLVFYVLLLAMDYGYAFSLRLWFHIFVISLAVIFTCCIWLITKSNHAFVPLGFFVLGMLIMPFWDLSLTKPNHRFFRSVKPGMTEAEVLAKLAYYFPEGGEFPRPVKNLYGEPENGIVFHLDPKDPMFNAEIVHIYLKDGVVVK